ncbi:c-type cytochrome biogenesis protein CcmI [Aureimonas populi]|uniref:C-type cytochrome biogenesis protein CcmI n=1 Tax=Aureimonas populi TaxID=1701758 RepID=A0ABW5CIE3_9HYPH|nr:c-type cytochrome biogenesis protein CcmI [Aureimonas populi]
MTIFWTIAAVLTAAVTFSTAWPLLRRADPARAHAGEGAHDVEVYRAQMAELEADRRRGLLAEGEAATARAEIGRRLLKAAAAARSTSAPPAARGLPLAGLAVVLALPLGSFLLYGQLGMPRLPDLPLAQRMEGEAQGLAAMIEAAEARLAQDPQDGRGWDVLAPIYLRIGEAGRAAEAFSRASALLGESAPRLTGLGEALVQASGGRVTPQARQAFEGALRLEPGALSPRFFLALALSQEGRHAQAAPAWEGLIADSPDDAPWRAVAESALAEARAVPAGPSAAEIAAASEMDEEARGDMIEGMVSGLAARLETEPQDFEGWARLIRAYRVLGREADGRAAAERAAEAFGPASREAADLRALAANGEGRP